MKKNYEKELEKIMCSNKTTSHILKQLKALRKQRQHERAIESKKSFEKMLNAINDFVFN